VRRKHPDKEDLQYYSLHLGEYSYREIADIFGVSVRTAWQGVQRAKRAEVAAAEAEKALADKVAAALIVHAEKKPGRRDPSWTRDAVVNFGCMPFTPDSPCAHSGPYEPGSDFYCPKCDISGRDADPYMRRDPAADPKPEPKPTPKAGLKPNRKERRRRERTAA
jgi:hypothetical protein